jgi:aconitase B
MTSNMVMLKWMLSEGYGDTRTIERRIASMQVQSAARVVACHIKGTQF